MPVLFRMLVPSVNIEVRKSGMLTGDKFQR